MKTDREELEALLYQTRLKIEENQKEEMLSRLNKDLEFIEDLFEVNVENIPPLYHVIDLPEYLREDKEGETLDNQTIMNLCRSGEYGYIVVPAVPAALENSEHQVKRFLNKNRKNNERKNKFFYIQNSGFMENFFKTYFRIYNRFFYFWNNYYICKIR